MKIVQMDTRKEAIKPRLEAIAKRKNTVWHSQDVHKIAVCAFILDSLGVSDQALRDEAMKQFLATPSSFGCNASALGQQLGRESAREKTEKLFAGF